MTERIRILDVLSIPLRYSTKPDTNFFLMDASLLGRIEAQRTELEANIAKLRKSLHHWTALELDYEGLKDEFWPLREGATKEDCLKAANSFGPQRVDEKELNDLIEPTRGKIRSPPQLVDVLSKRIDYVLRNAETLRKQISDLEKKRNAILLAGHPEHEAEAGLPLAEITEELDDDGNVLSSSVQQQGDTAKKVLNVLEKVTDGSPRHATSSVLSHSQTEGVGVSDDDTLPSKIECAVHAQQASPNDCLEDVDDTEKRSSQTGMKYPSNPNDTEEEAEMRREMIQYGLGEVGNIVAELEMTDGNEDEEMTEDFDIVDDDEEDDTDEDDEEDSLDDSEDESGRSKTAIHTDEYRKQMEALQKELGFKMENMGPLSSSSTKPELKEHIDYLRDSEFKEHVGHLPPELRKRFVRAPAAEAARKAAIAREEAGRLATNGDEKGGLRKFGGKSSKKVTFASNLDIAPEPSSHDPARTSDRISETRDINQKSVAGPKSASVSRFKAGRSVQHSDQLLPPPMKSSQTKKQDREGPKGRTVAENLIERPGTVSTEDAPPPDGDDFDEELQKRQIALEHHRLRNRMIHEQGGYVKGGEADNWGDAYAAPKVQDEKTGQPVKVSRFKAARMRS